MHPTFVLYHGGGCADGFAAAVAAYMRLGDTATYIAVNYGDPLPEIPDAAEVAILDFSYPRAVLEALDARCWVKVIDHHKTAAEDLRGLTIATFDQTKSGAVLAWEYFHGSEVPVLLQYIQDRDLWQWQLPESQEVSAALQITPFNLEVWAQMIQGGELAINDLARRGAVCLAFRTSLVDRLCNHAVFCDIAGHSVPVVNSPMFQSEIGNELLIRHECAPFAAAYFDKPGKCRVWSLRSRADFDCSEVARLFGGGGHAQAAGFEIPQDAIVLNPPNL